MSLTLSAAAVFPLAGAANAAVLSLALGLRAVGRRSRAGLYGAGFLASAAAATVVITLDHAGFTADSWLQFAEGILTLLSGALFAQFVGTLMDRKLPLAGLFLPAMVFVCAAIVAPAFVLNQVRVEALVLVQGAFTVLAAWMAFSPQREGRANARRQQIARLAVGAMAAIHTAQMVRTLTAAEAVRDVVPFAIATIFFVLAGIVYFGARATALDSIFAERTSSPETAALLGRLDAAIGPLLKRPDLGAAEVANAIGTTSEALLKAIAGERGLSLKEYLLEQRVTLAKRLLLDPQEARTSMEAIGLLAGFGSRSAFYKAFREQTGASPAAYRAEMCPEN
ncbi:MAG: helix-turn-helix transcriptional regulator [Hyphomonadaceae bacterium]